jgi:glycolate oxidase FAD binding subunit
MSSSDPAATLDIRGLLASVRSIVGEDGVQEQDLTAYLVDDRGPGAAAFPRAAEEVAAVLAAADEAGAAVIPWGSGAHMRLGNPPRAYDLALSAARLDRVLEYEPADLTVTVEAGIPLSKLQARLAEHGQFLPLDPPGSPEATVGGVLAANASGPSRHAHGTARDLLLGCRVAHCDGTLSRGGGRVVKNVAGYDMPKLYVGSLGTLGIIVEATFRAAPLPAVQETLVAAFPTAAAAAEAGSAAIDLGLSLRALELMDPAFTAALSDELGLSLPEDAWGLAAWTVGSESAVRRSMRELEALCRGATTQSRLQGGSSESLWGCLRGLMRPEAAELATKASVLSSDVPRLMDSLSDLAQGSAIPISSVAHLGVGVVYSRWRLAEGPSGAEGVALARVVSQAEAAARDLGGSLVVEQAPPALKEHIDVWGPLRADFELIRRIKEQFDPRGTLSPGRFLGRL